MAERLAVTVRNNLEGIKITANRQLPDGTSDLDTEILYGGEEQFPLDGLEVSLRIKSPEGLEMKTFPLTVKSDIDLTVDCSISQSYWTLKIAPNELPPEVPTTANVDVGDDRPG